MMAGYSSDSSDSDNPLSSKVLDFSYLMMDSKALEHNLESFASADKRTTENIETLLLYHNQLRCVPISVKRFENLRSVDLSSNRLRCIPEILLDCNLTTLIIKNNVLDEDSFPKSFRSLAGLKELNLSGNNLTRFPEQILELSNLRYLYLGGNRITNIPKGIWKLEG